MSGQFPTKILSVAILSRLCYLHRRLTITLEHVIVMQRVRLPCVYTNK